MEIGTEHVSKFVRHNPFVSLCISAALCRCVIHAITDRESTILLILASVMYPHTHIVGCRAHNFICEFSSKACNIVDILVNHIGLRHHKTAILNDIEADAKWHEHTVSEILALTPESQHFVIVTAKVLLKSRHRNRQCQTIIAYVVVTWNGTLCNAACLCSSKGCYEH